MKTSAFLLLLFPFLCLRCAPTLEGADTPPNPTGHWEGAITLPSNQLGVRVDLTRAADGSAQGTIDIPAQGAHGFKLSAVNLDPSAIEFAMAGVPGNPKFSGRLAADGSSLTGEFQQSGATFPFKLERRVAVPPALAGDGIVGSWLGTLKPTPTIELRLALEVTSADPEKPDGALVSLDQGNARIPLTAVTIHDRTVHLEAGSAGVVYDGTFNTNGSELSGEWKQHGHPLPLLFKRQAKAVTLAINRPQEPKKPYPYDEETVSIKTPDNAVTLAGTLALPRGTGPFPAVVLITGSGPQDRDEALAGHRPFLVLSDYLVRHGIAVLRCDDRGFAKSTGNFAAAIEADFVSDALASITYLESRKEIDHRKIGLVGHSEGSLIAMRAAVKSPAVAFVVSLAGPALPLEQIVLQQSHDILLAMGVSVDAVAANDALQHQLFQILHTEPDPAAAKKAIKQAYHNRTASLSADQRKALGNMGEMPDAALGMMVSPWFRDLLQFNPRTTLMAVKCPVLALNGEKDLQVSARQNLPALRAALEAGGNRQVKAVELLGLNHLFQSCHTGTPAEYSQIEETFSPEALKLIADWIRATAGVAGS